MPSAAPSAALDLRRTGCTRAAGTTTSVAYAPDAPKNDDGVARRGIRRRPSPTAVTTPAPSAPTRRGSSIAADGAQAGAQLRVDRVDAGRLDADRDLAVARDRVGDLDQGEDLGSAELGVDDRVAMSGATCPRRDGAIPAAPSGCAAATPARRCRARCANRLTRYSSSSQRACTSAAGASARQRDRAARLGVERRGALELRHPLAVAAGVVGEPAHALERALQVPRQVRRAARRPCATTKPGKTSPASWPLTSFSAPSRVSEFCARTARSTSRASGEDAGGQRHGLEELVDDSRRERVAHGVERGRGCGSRRRRRRCGR